MNNYPDDIHYYDSDPRSPFFVEDEESDVNDIMDSINSARMEEEEL